MECRKARHERKEKLAVKRQRKSISVGSSCSGDVVVNMDDFVLSTSCPKSRRTRSNTQTGEFLSRCNEELLMNEDNGKEDFTIFSESDNQVSSDVGDMNTICQSCGALVWYGERAQESSKSDNPPISMCCMKGKIMLPHLNKPPPLLWNLMHGIDSRSSHFVDNVRSYNSMFAFTSLGGKIESSLNDGGGPPQFILSGQNYHRIGSLLPNNGEQAKFAQLYIYDTRNEIDNRLSHFSGVSFAGKLDKSLVNDLLAMVDQCNVLVKSFRRVRDVLDQAPNVDVTLRLFRHRPSDARMYNLPTVDEVAALIMGDFDGFDRGRDIILRKKDGQLQRIHETHTSYIPLQYPLLFPYGENGYQENIPFREGSASSSNRGRVRVSLREFIAYRIMERINEDSIILRSRRLFQQFVVDAYSMIESQRLSFIRSNQSKIRSEFLMGIEEAVNRGDTEPSSIGSRVVLPSSFTGGRRYMFNNCQDAMAICKRFGYPDLFLTMTCNLKWPEIQRCLLDKGTPVDDHPDIACRVFRLKLEEMMGDFKKGDFFGKVIACMYTIEFQKRGLPHAHILLWLSPTDKLHSPSSIDSVISAELPDDKLFPKLFSIVTNFMVHRPCGVARRNSPCMKDGKCSKFYPKKFVAETSFDDSGYPIYKRRDFGVTTLKKGIEMDNRSLVPYNPKLLMKYQAHINIEYCNKSNCIKYLFKYVNKGPDMVTISMSTCVEDNVDEIRQYYDCRYLSPCESVWRIFAFDIHHRWPPVQRLTFHLPRQQNIIFNDFERLDEVMDRNKDKQTMFLSWMEANRVYKDGRRLTYVEFPMQFVYLSDEKKWHPRKKGQSIGRLSFVPPGTGELYYLRLLLNTQVGCKSYEEIRTVAGCTYNTFREACSAMGLLADDKEFVDGIIELSTLASGIYLRKLFTTLLLTNSMRDPLYVWDQTWEILSDGILYERRRILNCPDLFLPNERLKMLCLVEIEKLLRLNGKSLKEFECMPCVDMTDMGMFENILLINEMRYDKDDMFTQHDEHFRSLNCGQKAAYDCIINAVNSDLGGLFFVDGYGGTGKTYLWKALSFRLHHEGKIVLNVASSGIASLLLPGGRTVHSQFAIPLILDENSCCNIKQGSMKVELLQHASLIIWDEAPMVNKWAFEALDRTLRDIMRFTVANSIERPFGGKTIVLGGDFRQILPVIPKASRADIVFATINSSRLWQYCKVLKLTENMRLQCNSNDEYGEVNKAFAEWILKIGNGELGENNDGDADIDIPGDLLIHQSTDHILDIVEATYPQLINNMFNPKFFEDRAILAPTLDIVERVNEFVLSSIPGEEKEYLSCDSICKIDEEIGIDNDWLTTEFLNDIRCSGLPNHKLVLKKGVPVMLLRNIDMSSGLCNGTRLIVVELGVNIIGAKVVTGHHAGDKVYIPRMNLVPSDSSIPIKFQRRQFPLSLCFAMTINKSQGQTLSCVGLYLPTPVFSYGQLYVAVSRVKSRCGLKILISNELGELCNVTKNVVYKEVFQKM